MLVDTIKKCLFGLFFCFCLSGCFQSMNAETGIEDVRQQMQALDRGRYVIVVMGCNDCHTPDYILKRGNIVEQDWLVGTRVGFKSRKGTSYPTNLRLLVDQLTEDDWLLIARKMRKETPMADVMLPQTAESDLRAMYRFIKYLGPKGSTVPERLPPGVVPKTPYISSRGPHQ